MSSTVDTSIPLTLVGKKGSNPLPMLEKLWEFYTSKGIKTVFVSVGTSSSPLGELEIAETLGCPLHIVEYNEENLNKWSKVQDILKSRKDLLEPYDFTNEVINKWILPKNIRISNNLPFFYKGTIDINSSSIQTVDFDTYVKNICNTK